MDAAADGRKRRRFISVVDARFQWKYTLIITALGVLITAVLGAWLYRLNVQNTQILDLDRNHMLQEHVLRSDQIFLLSLIAAIVAMGVMLALLGLIITHRVSGPLHIVGRYLGALADGQYPDMRPLRKHDELHEFFATFEEAVLAMRNRDVEMLRNIEEALEAAKSGNSEQATRVLTEYRDRLSDSLGGREEA